MGTASHTYVLEDCGTVGGLVHLVYPQSKPPPKFAVSLGHEWVPSEKDLFLWFFFLLWWLVGLENVHYSRFTVKCFHQ